MLRFQPKPIAVLCAFACFTIGNQWRAANGLPLFQ